MSSSFRCAALLIAASFSLPSLQAQQSTQPTTAALRDALQAKFEDRLCASDGSSGVAPGTLLKIRGTRKLSLEIEAIAHFLNLHLEASGEDVIRIEAKPDYPATCATRGLETGARIVAFDQRMQG